MEIELILKKNDLIDLAYYRAEKSPEVRRRRIVFRRAYTIAFLMIAIGWYLLDATPTLSIIFVILAALSALFYPSFHKWRVRRYVEKRIEQKSRPEYFTSRKMTIDDEELEIVSDSFENKIKWSLIDEIDVTPTQAFIAIDGVYSVIIPKSAITHGFYNEFVSALREKIEKPSQTRIRDNLGTRIIKELDVVELLHDMEEYGLKRGDVGTAVHVYKDNAAYEVEFIAGNGETMALLTLTPKDIQLASRG